MCGSTDGLTDALWRSARADYGVLGRERGCLMPAVDDSFTVQSHSKTVDFTRSALFLFGPSARARVQAARDVALDLHDSIRSIE
jgi:hypothetical protein